MTTAQVNATDVFADARRMHEAALERMAAGDIRDAAEKAWCAMVRATEALVIAHTGEQPHTSTSAGRRLRAIAETDLSFRELRIRYIECQNVLHGECFYHGYCEPVETERLIRATADYIRDAERLAEV